LAIRRWEQGRSTIEALLGRGQLTRVTANRDLADTLLSQARAHLVSAAAIAEADPAGAFALAYDAARKALTAILVNQGLRARGDGAHAVLLDAVRAQLDPPLGGIFRPFGWMRPLPHRVPLAGPSHRRSRRCPRGDPRCDRDDRGSRQSARPDARLLRSVRLARPMA
jgi:hypothetical protein